MRTFQSITPISELKTHASEIVNGIIGSGNTLVITQNGEAKAVLQDIRAYEELQESLALLKILAQSQQSLRKSPPVPADEVFRDLRRRNAAKKRSW